MKHVLVIGGDSYLGSKFIRDYSDNFIIKAISRKETDYENELVQEDLFNIDNSLFKETDIVINFAAIVHSPAKESEKLYRRVNFDLPLILLKKASDNGVEQFLQLSTIAVYGRAALIKADTKECPLDHYSRYKYQADLELHSRDVGAMKVVSLRPPMVYGINAPGNLMKLIEFTRRGYPMPLKNVNAKRHFIHINNLTQFIFLTITNQVSGIYIPADLEPVSIQTLVSEIQLITLGKTRLFSINRPGKMLIKWLIPNLFYKIFSPMIVVGNDYHKTLGYNPEKNILTELKAIC